MPTKVGKLHIHKLPDEATVPRYEVYRCDCNREFFRGNQDNTNEPTWIPLDSSPHYVEYEVDDSPLIGRYVPLLPGVQRPSKGEDTAEETAVEPGTETVVEATVTEGASGGENKS